MRFLRYRTLLPTLRNQTTDKNFTRVEVPVTNREHLYLSIIKIYLRA